MHGKSMVYFSSKRENVLVYLSNAVEKYIKEKYNRPLKKYKKWATYGFNHDGKIRIEEYYENAIEDTFKGVKGYIYFVNNIETQGLDSIQGVFTIDTPTVVDGVEVIEDAYDEIWKAKDLGLIEIQRYHEMSDKKKSMVQEMIVSEYKNTDNEDYKEFLFEKFKHLRNIFKECESGN